MRKLMAVAVLGGVLALSTSAAFASERDDNEYLPPFQPAQIVVTDKGTDHSMVAGGDNDAAPRGPYQQLRDENFGR